MTTEHHLSLRFLFLIFFMVIAVAQVTQEIDECQTDSHNCDVNAVCNKTKGSYNCTCKPGFKGDGKKCYYYWMKSAILGDNTFYQRTLYQFLKPTAGSQPNWRLCYRASRNGWAGDTFHNWCDGRSHTVTIIKKGQYLFGGYTDIPWDSSNSYGNTAKAFIFSLHNKECLDPFKSIVTKPQYAIYRGKYKGPIFGGGYDIFIPHDAFYEPYKSYTNFGDPYSVPSGVQNSSTILAGTKYFTPDDLEVFYLGSNKYSSTNFGGIFKSYYVPRQVHVASTILAGDDQFTPDELEVFYLG